MVNFLLKTSGIKAFDDLNFLYRKKWKDNYSKHIQEELSKFSDEQKKLIWNHLLDKILVTAMYDFLFALEVANDHNKGIQMQVDGKNIANISDGFQGEIFSEDGWIVKYSKYESKCIKQFIMTPDEEEMFFNELNKLHNEQDNSLKNITDVM